MRRRRSCTRLHSRRHSDAIKNGDQRFGLGVDRVGKDERVRGQRRVMEERRGEVEAAGCGLERGDGAQE
jgi:hypothetical protein